MSENGQLPREDAPDIDWLEFLLAVEIRSGFGPNGRRATALTHAIAALREIDSLRAELRAVDLALGNRSAFDADKTRAGKIAHAIRAAGVADPQDLTGEIARLRDEVAILRELVRNVSTCPRCESCRDTARDVLADVIERMAKNREGQ